MSQYDFGTLDPFVVDGVTLAFHLNSWRTALYTMQRGSTRPAFAVPGQVWCNDAAGPSNWIVNYYVSPTVGDKPLFSINTTTGDITWHAAILGGPYLPMAGSTATAVGATNFGGLLTALGGIAIDYVTGHPTQIFRAQANAANTKVFELVEQADGTLSIRAVTDDLTTLQGEAKVNRDGTMAVTAPATGAAGTEVVTASWVRALVTAAAAGVPVGAIMPFGGAGAAPAGWLLCAGQAVSRTTYAALWTAFGTTSSPHGLGDGSTTFNVPDLRGRAPFGSDAMGGIAANRLGGALSRPGGIQGSMGSTGGEQSHTLAAGEGPNMTVSVSGGPVTGTYEFDAGIPPGGGSPSISPYGGAYPNPQNFLTMGTSTGSTSGGGASHNTVPPGYVLNYIIKY